MAMHTLTIFSDIYVCVCDIFCNECEFHKCSVMIIAADAGETEMHYLVYKVVLIRIRMDIYYTTGSVITDVESGISD